MDRNHTPKSGRTSRASMPHYMQPLKSKQMMQEAEAPQKQSRRTTSIPSSSRTSSGPHTRPSTVAKDWEQQRAALRDAYNRDMHPNGTALMDKENMSSIAALEMSTSGLREEIASGITRYSGGPGGYIERRIARELSQLPLEEQTERVTVERDQMTMWKSLRTMADNSRKASREAALAREAASRSAANSRDLEALRSARARREQMSKNLSEKAADHESWEQAREAARQQELARMLDLGDAPNPCVISPQRTQRISPSISRPSDAVLSFRPSEANHERLGRFERPARTPQQRFPHDDEADSAWDAALPTENVVLHDSRHSASEVDQNDEDATEASPPLWYDPATPEVFASAGAQRPSLLSFDCAPAAMKAPSFAKPPYVGRREVRMPRPASSVANDSASSVTADVVGTAIPLVSLAPLPPPGFPEPTHNNGDSARKASGSFDRGTKDELAPRRKESLPVREEMPMVMPHMAHSFHHDSPVTPEEGGTEIRIHSAELEDEAYGRSSGGDSELVPSGSGIPMPEEIPISAREDYLAMHATGAPLAGHSSQFQGLNNDAPPKVINPYCRAPDAGFAIGETVSSATSSDSGFVSSAPPPNSADATNAAPLPEPFRAPQMAPSPGPVGVTSDTADTVRCCNRISEHEDCAAEDPPAVWPHLSSTVESQQRTRMDRPCAGPIIVSFPPSFGADRSAPTAYTPQQPPPTMNPSRIPSIPAHLDGGTHEKAQHQHYGPAVSSCIPPAYIDSTQQHVSPQKPMLNAAALNALSSGDSNVGVLDLNRPQSVPHGIGCMSHGMCAPVHVRQESPAPAGSIASQYVLPAGPMGNLWPAMGCSGASLPPSISSCPPTVNAHAFNTSYSTVSNVGHCSTVPNSPPHVSISYPVSQQLPRSCPTSRCTSPVPRRMQTVVPQQYRSQTPPPSIHMINRGMSPTRCTSPARSPAAPVLHPHGAGHMMMHNGGASTLSAYVWRRSTGMFHRWSRKFVKLTPDGFLSWTADAPNHSETFRGETVPISAIYGVSSESFSDGHGPPSHGPRMFGTSCVLVQHFRSLQCWWCP